ncbi:hypothetical protein D3C72_1402970 [compost metagenome]
MSGVGGVTGSGGVGIRRLKLDGWIWELEDALPTRPPQGGEASAERTMGRPSHYSAELPKRCAALIEGLSDAVDALKADQRGVVP